MSFIYQRLVQECCQRHEIVVETANPINTSFIIEKIFYSSGPTFTSISCLKNTGFLVLQQPIHLSISGLNNESKQKQPIQPFDGSVQNCRTLKGLHQKMYPLLNHEIMLPKKSILHLYSITHPFSLLSFNRTLGSITKHIFQKSNL